MEPNPTSPTAGFSPLADLAHTPLFIGTSGTYLSKADGTRVDRELVAISMQLRLAEAYEGTKGTTRLARLAVSLSDREAFINVVAIAAQEWGTATPNVHESEDQPGVRAVVTVAYTRAEELFYLGTRWQQRQDAVRKEGGLTHA